MMCIGYVPCAKNGIEPNRYSSVKRPMPTLFNPTPTFATRTSTLATLELVSTLPHTVSPDPTLVELISTSTICGGASGDRIGTTTRLRTTGVGVGDGTADRVAAGEGVGLGDGVTSATMRARFFRRFFGAGATTAATTGAGVVTVSDEVWSTRSWGCEAHAVRTAAARRTSDAMGRYTAGHHSLPPFWFRLLGAAREATNGSKL